MKRVSYHAPATILPFYETKEEQYRFASEKGQDYKLYCDPYNTMIPFQIFIPLDTPVVDTSYQWHLFIVGDEDTPEYDLVAAGASLQILQVPGVGLWAINDGNNDDATWSSPELYYYFRVIIAGKTLYSEVFYMPCAEELASLNKLQWRNNCDIFNTVYSPDEFTFLNKFFFKGETEKGQTIIEEEVDSNEYGEDISLLTTYKDSFEITDVVPFYVQEAIGLMKMHSTVRAVHLKGLLLQEESNQLVKVTESNVEWFNEDRFKGLMTLRIQANTMLKTACCSNFDFM